MTPQQLLLTLLIAASTDRVEPELCTYATYEWSTEQGRAVNRRRVEHPYAEVTGDERSPDDPRCTVCSEDQATIDPRALGVDLEPFEVCWVYRDGVEAALREVVASGEFDLTEITGYRPGRTRGRVVDGVRTEWSNHAFGTAVDINADANGLYRSCDIDAVTAEAVATCHLGVGGRWDPHRFPRRSIIEGGVVYRAFTGALGWRWGGEIEGATRDLMHFSLTGY